MMAPRTESDPPLAGAREWWGLALLFLPAFLISLDFTVLTLAVPKMSEALHPSANGLIWMVDVYGFTLAGFLLTMGALGDRIGRRRLLLLGATGFGAASTLAAFSSSTASFIAARAVLGIAGATLLPSTMALIRVMFPDEKERTKAVAIWSTALPIGGAVGPLIGGLLLDWFWWGSVFLIGVPVMGLLLAAGRWLLPEYRNPEATRPDLFSAALSLVAVVGCVYGLQEVATGSAGAPSVVSLVVGLLSALAFVRRQQRTSHPLVDPRLVSSRGFSAALTANLFSEFVILGMFVLVAQFLQLVLGLSALQAGLWTIPSMVGLIVGSLGTPILLKWLQAPLAMAVGFLIAAAGFALVAQADGSGGLGLVVAGMTVFSLGLAPVFTLVIDLVIGTAAPDQTGAASGLSETTTELGGALGIAVLGTIAIITYRSDLPQHLSRLLSTAQRQTFQSTLGGAVSASRGLPSHVRRAVLTQADTAFGAGLRLAAWVSVGIVVLLCLGSLSMLRRPVESSANQFASSPIEPEVF